MAYAIVRFCVIGAALLATACSATTQQGSGEGGGGPGGQSPTGGAGGQGGDGAGGSGGTTGLVPRDEPDDTTPYDLAADCDALPSWANTLPVGLDRVHALGRDEAIVVTADAAGAAGGALLHLHPDGTVTDPGYGELHDVWGCETADGEHELWAVGKNGTALRKRGDDAWEKIELDTSAEIRGGAGCDDEVWLGANEEVLVLRPDGITRLPTPPTQNGPSFEAARVHATGTHRIVTAYYGTTLAWNVEQQDFVLIGDTDDLVSGAFVRRDGSGMSLHYGYALEIHVSEPYEHTNVPDLVAMSVHRRADDDVVIVGGDEVVFDDGETRDELTTTEQGLTDVHARSDAVWVVGFDGAQILTDAGWCQVATKM